MSLCSYYVWCKLCKLSINFFYKNILAYVKYKINPFIKSYIQRGIIKIIIILVISKCRTVFFIKFDVISDVNMTVAM